MVNPQRRQINVAVWSVSECLVTELVSKNDDKCNSYVAIMFVTITRTMNGVFVDVGSFK